MINQEITQYLRNRFRLDWKGVHGSSHWARVKHNGLFLADCHEGIDTDVVQLFAFFHDIERFDDDDDIWHGARSAKLVKGLNGDLFNLSNKQLDLLVKACENHSHGYLEDDITVMACWDADRLDLGRVGVYPDASKLCLSASKDSKVIEQCYLGSINNRIEDVITRPILRTENTND